MTDQRVVSRHRVAGAYRGSSNQRNANGHKTLYHRWINELWAGHRIAEQLVSADFVGHWPTHDVHGPQGLQTVIDNTRGTLRELVFVVDVGPFIDGDMLSARWIGTGSGKNGPARFIGNDILRIANGKVVEYWSGTSQA